MTVSVLIVDDQAMVRAGFAAILDAQPDIEVVGQAADGEEGVALFASAAPRCRAWMRACPARTGSRPPAVSWIPPRVDHRPRVVILTTFDIDECASTPSPPGRAGSC